MRRKTDEEIRGKVNERSRRYREKHREEVLAAKRLYAAEHKLHQYERTKEWQARNPEKVKAARKRWRLAHVENVRIYRHNRRARERTNGGQLSPGLAEKLFALQKGKCACCGKPLGEDYQLDHKLPIALGGANEDWNMQILRQKCNKQKGAKHPIEFMNQRGFLL